MAAITQILDSTQLICGSGLQYLLGFWFLNPRILNENPVAIWSDVSVEDHVGFMFPPKDLIECFLAQIWGMNLDHHLWGLKLLPNL